VRATILIRRKRELSDQPNWIRTEPTLTAAEAISALAVVPTISELRVVAEAGDRVLVSFETEEKRQRFEAIDAVLQAEGLQRLQ
jgi:hypothetical protein